LVSFFSASRCHTSSNGSSCSVMLGGLLGCFERNFAMFSNITPTKACPLHSCDVIVRNFLLVCLSVCLSLCLSVCMYVCLYVCLRVCLQDQYLHTNCLAALANMSAQFSALHPYVSQRLVKYGPSCQCISAIRLPCGPMLP